MSTILLPRPVRLGKNQELLGVDPRDNRRIWRPGMGWTWEKAVFSVPGDVEEERVQFAASKYRNKFGDHLETQGFEILGMDGPHRDGSVLGIGVTHPDRRRYVIWAKVRRRPVEVKVQVPDEDVPIYQEAGFKLIS